MAKLSKGQNRSPPDLQQAGDQRTAGKHKIIVHAGKALKGNGLLQRCACISSQKSQKYGFHLTLPSSKIYTSHTNWRLPTLVQDTDVFKAAVQTQASKRWPELQ